MRAVLQNLSTVDQTRLFSKSRGFRAIGVAICVALAPAVCFGQGGVRAGEFEFKPLLSIAGEYDSNFWRESEQDFTKPVNPVYVLRLRGGLEAQNRTPNKVAFSGRTNLGVRSATGDESEAASYGTALSDLSGETSVEFLPNSPLSFAIEGTGNYTDRPASENIKEGGYEFLRASVGPVVRFAPGAKPESRALMLELGYAFGLTRALNDSEALGLTRANKDEHTFGAELSWKFFPKTALVLSGDYRLVDYQQTIDVTADGTETVGDNRDMRPLTVEGGLRGLITPRLSVDLRGGYLTTANVVGESYGGPVFKASADYRLRSRLMFTASYKYRVGDDSYANYYVVNSIAAQMQLRLPMQSYVGVNAGFDNFEYSTSGTPNYARGEGDTTSVVPAVRVEPIFRVGGTAGWNPMSWMAVEVYANLEDNQSTYLYCAGPEPGRCQQGDPVDFAEYTRVVAGLTLTARY